MVATIAKILRSIHETPPDVCTAEQIQVARQFFVTYLVQAVMLEKRSKSTFVDALRRLEYPAEFLMETTTKDTMGCKLYIQQLLVARILATNDEFDGLVSDVVAEERFKQRITAGSLSKMNAGIKQVVKESYLPNESWVPCTVPPASSRGCLDFFLPIDSVSVGSVQVLLDSLENYLRIRNEQSLTRLAELADKHFPGHNFVGLLGHQKDNSIDSATTANPCDAFVPRNFLKNPVVQHLVRQSERTEEFAEAMQLDLSVLTSLEKSGAGLLCKEQDHVVVQLLGNGAFAIVCKAFHKSRPDVMYALKVQASSKTAFSKECLRQLEMQSRCDEQYVVQMYGWHFAQYDKLVMDLPALPQDVVFCIMMELGDCTLVRLIVSPFSWGFCSHALCFCDRRTFGRANHSIERQLERAQGRKTTKR